MPGSLRLGKLAGIDVSIHVSWLVIVVLLTWSLATGWFPVLYPAWAALTYWAIAVVASLLFFASVLAHELVHSLVVRRRGLPVKNITLFIFGGVSNIEQEPRSPGIEFQMSFVGPLTSLLIGGLSYLLLLALHGGTSPLAALLGYLALANILLGLFNLVPREKLHAVSPQQSLNEVLPLMVDRDVNQLPVVEDAPGRGVEPGGYHAFPGDQAQSWAGDGRQVTALQGERMEGDGGCRSAAYAERCIVA